MIHITCNMGAHDSPDMYALSPRACGPRAYISGKSLSPMLQLLHVTRYEKTVPMCTQNLITFLDYKF